MRGQLFARRMAVLKTTKICIRAEATTAHLTATDTTGRIGFFVTKNIHNNTVNVSNAIVMNSFLSTNIPSKVKLIKRIDLDFKSLEIKYASVKVAIYMEILPTSYNSLNEIIHYEIYIICYEIIDELCMSHSRQYFR